jgi:hypothetical protein
MILLTSCATTPEVRIVTKIEYAVPDQSFYNEPIDSGLVPGMTLKDIITTLTTSLGQANDDRSQIKEWVIQLTY